MSSSNPPQVMDDTFERLWSHVVSVANWAKGDLLVAIGDEFEADKVARMVGGVTPETIERLRAVAYRFPKHIRQQYPHLVWSHFLAALDWDDAKQWLQFANTKRLNAAAMRMQRFNEKG